MATGRHGCTDPGHYEHDSHGVCYRCGGYRAGEDMGPVIARELGMALPDDDDLAPTDVVPRR